MKKILITLTITLFTQLLYCQTSSAPSGSGTSADPYLIASLENLYWLSQTSSAWAAETYFSQTQNIDATETSSWSGYFTPIGTSSGFSGNYDGNNYAISNLTITDSFATGLFSIINAGGTLENINITNISGSATNCTVGGLAGKNNGTIDNCSTSGTLISNNVYLGGLVGENYGIIKNSSSSCNIQTSQERSGGLVGQMGGGTIENCFATGSLNPCHSYSGGLVGFLGSGSISKSYATGDLSSTGPAVGGLVGECKSTITDSYARGNVTSSSGALGGLVGYNNNGTITNCYSTGIVTTTSSETVCGLTGANGTVNTSFWDCEASGNTEGAGTSATTSDMKDYSTFTDAGWDFVSESTNGNEDIWDADQAGDLNDGYPILSWQEGADNALPVELTMFAAAVVNDVVELTWQTATEVNNYGFEIERLNPPPYTSRPRTGELVPDYRAEKRGWVNVGFVVGHGNSNSPKRYEFVDVNPPAGELEYRLKQIDTDGTYVYYAQTAGVNNAITDVEYESELPSEFILYQNYPNPFNPTTTIQYQIPLLGGDARGGLVTLKVFDMLGREAATLVNEMQPPGNYSVTFDASSVNRRMASGIYIYKLQAGKFEATKKLILMK